MTGFLQILDEYKILDCRWVNFRKINQSAYASVTFATIVVRFICLRFSLRFFGIVGGYKLRRMCLYCLRSPYDFFCRKPGQTLQRPCGYRTTTARLSYNHRVIFKTSLYKSHDARTMTLRTSQGVGTLTVHLSCNYVLEFKHFCIPFELCFKVM